MKKLLLLFVLFPNLLFAQGGRIQPGGVPTPVPVYNISQIVSNILQIIGTNFGIGYQSQSADASLIIATNTTSHVYTMRVNTNLFDYNGAANNSSNALYTLFNFGALGFVTLITNGSSTATIQAAFDGVTNNGVISVQPGVYSITSTLNITNAMIIEGNGATFSYATPKTNFMMDTGTNYAKALVINNLKFDGGTYLSYNNTNYFHLENRGVGFGGDASLYYNTFYTNRTGLRAEVSGGVLINNCTFIGWSGNGGLFLSKVQGLEYTYPKLLYLYNHCNSNFCSVYLANIAEDTLGYYNNGASGQGPWSCEYALVALNDIINGYVGISAAPGNVKVDENFIDECFIALILSSQNGNSGHGTYCNNTFNHNNYAIWSWFNSGGIYKGNAFLRNGQEISSFGTNIIYPNGNSSGIHFDKVDRVDFSDNQLSRESLTFTNCYGNFDNNTYGGLSYGTISSLLGDSNLVWGVDVPTNFGPGMRIWGNTEVQGILNDGSAGSVFSTTTNALFARSFLWSPNGANSAAISMTNMVMATNLPATPGQALVILGTNASGALLVMPTNWPTGGSGITEGQAATQIADSAIVQTNGTGTNTVLGSPTLLQGAYKEFYLANGAFLRTNTIAPFDWEFKNTNGTITHGTNTVTKVTADALGNVIYPSANGGIISAKQFTAAQNLFVAAAQFSINQFGAIVNTVMAAASGSSNIIFIDSSGNWNTNGSMPGGFITPSSIPTSAADTSWMPITNAVAYSSSTGLPIVGNALVIIGTNSYGAILVVPTNWPSGGGNFSTNSLGVSSFLGVMINTNFANGSAVQLYASSNAVSPFGNGLMNSDGNSSTVPWTGSYFGSNFVAAGQVVASNGITGNIVIANGGTSNWLGGISFVPSNAAPFSTVAPSGLNTIAMNQRWTNNFNRRADLLLNVTITDAATGVPILGFTNTITGESYTNSPNFGITGSPTYGIPYLDISPGDYGSISNYSTGTGTSITINSVWWKLH